VIQRIQTVFLLLISIASVLGFFFLPPLDLTYLGLSVLISLESYLVLSGATAFLTLLLFKKRKIQLMINRIHFVIQIGLAIVLIYGLFNTVDMNPFLLWLMMPFLSLILLLLSSKAIRKDEDLIRSIDRLR
jgi:glucose-6-phosphate-specific signal transduction histidine kinase